SIHRPRHRLRRHPRPLPLRRPLHPPPPLQERPPIPLAHAPVHPRGPLHEPALPHLPLVPAVRDEPQPARHPPDGVRAGVRERPRAGERRVGVPVGHAHGFPLRLLRGERGDAADELSGVFLDAARGGVGERPPPPREGDGRVGARGEQREAQAERVAAARPGVGFQQREGGDGREHAAGFRPGGVGASRGERGRPAAGAFQRAGLEVRHPLREEGSERPPVEEPPRPRAVGAEVDHRHPVPQEGQPPRGVDHDGEVQCGRGAKGKDGRRQPARQGHRVQAGHGHQGERARGDARAEGAKEPVVAGHPRAAGGAVLAVREGVEEGKCAGFGVPGGVREEVQHRGVRGPGAQHGEGGGGAEGGEGAGGVQGEVPVQAAQEGPHGKVRVEEAGVVSGKDGEGGAQARAVGEGGRVAQRGLEVGRVPRLEEAPPEHRVVPQRGTRGAARRRQGDDVAERGHQHRGNFADKFGRQVGQAGPRRQPQQRAQLGYLLEHEPVLLQPRRRRRPRGIGDGLVGFILRAEGRVQAAVECVEAVFHGVERGGVTGR
ncbi:hypothetical protein DFJ74DRAFT_719436, partial [Hyaloraphidium curvatum]